MKNKNHTFNDENFIFDLSILSLKNIMSARYTEVVFGCGSGKWGCTVLTFSQFS